MLFLLILYYRKQINYDLSDCLHASVTELRHICISKRWGSKLPLMKAAKVNINKRILSTLWIFLHCSICSYGEIKNCGIPAWYQYNGRNPMTLQKCRSFCVLNQKTPQKIMQRKLANVQQRFGRGSAEIDGPYDYDHFFKMIQYLPTNPTMIAKAR